MRVSPGEVCISCIYCVEIKTFCRIRKYICPAAVTVAERSACKYEPATSTAQPDRFINSSHTCSFAVTNNQCEYSSVIHKRRVIQGRSHDNPMPAQPLSSGNSSSQQRARTATIFAPGHSQEKIGFAFFCNVFFYFRNSAKALSRGSDRQQQPAHLLPEITPLASPLIL